MSSTNALVEVLEEYHYLAEPFDRGQLKEMANAVPPKDCRADEEFRESLTSRQREVLDEVPELVRDRIGRRARQESVKDVVGMQVDVSAQYRVTCDSYKEMLDTKTLNIKYFESGHTFMAVGSFHAAMKKQMNSSPPVTYTDFEEVVLTSGIEYFIELDLNISQYTLNQLIPRPYIDNIRLIQLKKGKIKIYELDVMLEDRHIEELRLDSLEVKYTMTDTLSKVALHQDSALPEVNTS